MFRRFCLLALRTNQATVGCYNCRNSLQNVKLRPYQTSHVNLEAEKDRSVFSVPSNRNRYTDSYNDLCEDETDEESAKAFIYKLNTEQRQLLYKSLHEFEGHPSAGPPVPPAPLSSAQLKKVFLVKCLPFIGFGFLDNLLMIIAGEYIDMVFGAALGISTMAAAGLGNCVSDMAGVGCGSYIEKTCMRLGVRAPALTALQINSRQVRWTSMWGKIVGVTLGCLIGMFPLLFFRKSSDKTDESNTETRGKS